MKSKYISERLADFLTKQSAFIPIIDSVDNLTEQDLEIALMNAKSCDFMVYEGENYDKKYYYAGYGFPPERYFTDNYDTYSEALENGVIELIDGFSNIKDIYGNPIYQIKE